MKVFGFAGKKQVGKDTSSDFIAELVDCKVKKISLAKPLKDFVNEAFHVPKENLWGSDHKKNYPLCTWGEIFFTPALTAYGKEPHSLLSGREILQVVGTDVMRQGNLNFLRSIYQDRCIRFLEDRFGPGKLPYNELWVDLLRMDIKVLEARNEADIVCIPDIRFGNEVELVKSFGSKGVLVRLYRDTGAKEGLSHPSELELDTMDDDLFDHVLYEHENKSLKQLRGFIIRVLQTEGLLPVGGMSI